ncbi:MAG: hypothetical protein ACI857_000692 [Arenicella sp.]|jgi:hypothetical protein
MRGFLIISLLFTVPNLFSQVKITTIIDEDLKGAVKEMVYESYQADVKRGKIIKTQGQLGSETQYRVSRFDKEGRETFWSTLKPDSTLGRGQSVSIDSSGMNYSTCHFNNYKDWGPSCDTVIKSEDGKQIMRHTYFRGQDFVKEGWSFDDQNRLIQHVNFDYGRDIDFYTFYIYKGLNDSLHRPRDVTPMAAEHYYLDSLGRTLVHQTLNLSGEINNSYINTYNDQGLLESKINDQKIIKQGMQVNSRMDCYKSLYNYDDEGNLVEHLGLEKNGDTTFLRLFNYKNNLLHSETLSHTDYYSSLSKDQITEYNYDMYGNQIEQSTLYVESRATFRKLRTIDQFGNWIKEEQFRNGKLDKIIERKISYYED